MAEATAPDVPDIIFVQSASHHYKFPTKWLAEPVAFEKSTRPHNGHPAWRCKGLVYPAAASGSTTIFVRIDDNGHEWVLSWNDRTTSTFTSTGGPYAFPWEVPLGRWKVAGYPCFATRVFLNPDNRVRASALKLNKLADSVSDVRHGLSSGSLAALMATSRGITMPPSGKELFMSAMHELCDTMVEEQEQALAEATADAHDRDAESKRQLVDIQEKMCFPDLELCVGRACESVWTNREVMTSASPFFAAMLADDKCMKETSSGRVEFPMASPQVTRGILCLLCTDGSAKLAAVDSVDMLAQAMEWQMHSVAAKALTRLCNGINEVSMDVALRAARLSSLHTTGEDAAGLPWEDLFSASVDRLAALMSVKENVNGFLELPFEILRPVLRSDKLETSCGEGWVLILVMEWSRRHGAVHLPELLRVVRFPFISLIALSEHEKSAMSYAKEKSPTEVTKLLGEATVAQLDTVGARRGERRGAARGEDEDRVRRSTKRFRGAAMPALSVEDLGVAMSCSV